MGPQVFQVDRFQSAIAQRFEHPAGMHQFAAREYVFFDEIAHAAAQLAVARTARGNPVVQHQPTRTKQAADLGKVAFQIDLPDMLEHADRRNLVE